MACSPTSSTDKSEREISDATNHLVSGKRHLLVNDYVSAVSSLQEACQLFSKQYGETANECAEPYLYYGKALLEYSRMESGVLGNALQGVNDEEEESEEEDEEEGDDKEEQVENPDKVTGEEREQIKQQVEAAIDENSRDLDQKMEEMEKADQAEGPVQNGTNDADADATKNPEEENKDEGSVTGEEESESTGEKSQDEGATPDGDEAGPSTSTGGPKEENEDEVTNLQLAWEMLELAKVIFKRQSETDKSKELKVAEVLLKLGEVSIESENYQQAIEDLTECLKLQKKHLAPHDRAIAETLYQLGLATSFNNQFELAIENFTNSMRVLEERIAILKQSEEDRKKLKDSKIISMDTSDDKDQEKTSKAEAAKDSKAEKAAKDSKAEDSIEDKKPEVSKTNEESIEDKKPEISKCKESTENKKPEISKSEDSTEDKKPEISKSEDSIEDKKPEISKTEESLEDKKSESSKTEDSKEKKSEALKSKADSIGEKVPEASTVCSKDEAPNEDSSEEPWHDTQKEIEELEGLIPDIKSKIEDTEDLMKNTVESIKEAALQRLTENSEASPLKSEENAKPISNISHLVKRKRKPEEESASESTEQKKPRPSEEIENHVNGDAVLNGDSKPMDTSSTEEPSKVKAATTEVQPEAESSVA